ncbi:MAG: hypothetical protein EPO45_17335 [Sphingobium sp.]|nr:MAG: hypothetical protein EPO45_17335 [Sphingobium sp.]
MKDLASLRRRALLLMREAMTLLDQAGEDLAMARLQAVLDTVERISPMRPPGEELPGDMAAGWPDCDRPVDPVLVRAIGGALSVIATVMARQGGTSLEEIARLLGIYAVVNHETATEEGMVIGCWGAMLLDVVEAHREGT